ncbi:MAG: DNA polymerase III subunit epsilon [Holosporaceae bacterium]|jgi:DNA polymerase-3 subunit epsilon|nr:DNA polymerase III subunit epsilon [Holosporaceae bacterium]
MVAQKSLKIMTISKYVKEIVLDTETTGLSHENGDRVVEIACVELKNHVPTGNAYQTYINPQRKMSREAANISKLQDEFLADKPLFREIADDFLNFIGDATLIIHNARFDVGFLNSELDRIGKPLLNLENIVDTLEIAKKKFPGMPANLDALCKRFDIDTSVRVAHGALIDSKLLAEVYINLLGGRQSGLFFATETQNTVQSLRKKQKTYERRYFSVSEEEISIHNEFLKSINDPLWNKQ